MTFCFNCWYIEHFPHTSCKIQLWVNCRIFNRKLWVLLVSLERSMSVPDFPMVFHCNCQYLGVLLSILSFLAFPKITVPLYVSTFLFSFSFTFFFHLCIQYPYNTVNVKCVMFMFCLILQGITHKSWATGLSRSLQTSSEFFVNTTNETNIFYCERLILEHSEQDILLSSSFVDLKQNVSALSIKHVTLRERSNRNRFPDW
jgi:hypothetical protein